MECNVSKVLFHSQSLIASLYLEQAAGVFILTLGEKLEGQRDLVTGGALSAGLWPRGV